MVFPYLFLCSAAPTPTPAKVKIWHVWACFKIIFTIGVKTWTFEKLNLKIHDLKMPKQHVRRTEKLLRSHFLTYTRINMSLTRVDCRDIYFDNYESPSDSGKIIKSIFLFVLKIILLFRVSTKCHPSKLSYSTDLWGEIYIKKPKCLSVCLCVTLSKKGKGQRNRSSNRI